jgi:hypothetical protein
MEIVTSWWGTLLVCGAVWWLTVFFVALMLDDTLPLKDLDLSRKLNNIFATNAAIAGFINSIFALLFIHLVLK